MLLNELKHHGIKGQKWGVRRYQNSDGSLTPLGRERYVKILRKQDRQAARGLRDTEYFNNVHTVPKGTKMYRTSVNQDETLNGSTYVTYLPGDRNRYRGGWVRNTGKTDTAYEHEYVLDTDLHVASRDDLKRSIKKVLNSDESLMRDTVSTWLSDKVGGYTTFLKRTSTKQFSKEFFETYDAMKSDDAQRKKATVEKYLSVFKDMNVTDLYVNTAMTFGLNVKARTQVIDELKKKGYNAMMDENSIGGQGRNNAPSGIAPMIIFDGGSSMHKSGTHQITDAEEKASAKKYERYLKKYQSKRQKNWGDSSLYHF